MAKSFISLEINDPEVIALIYLIRAAAAGRSAKSGAHVTIRGPYNRPLPAAQLRRYQRILSTRPVVLAGIDMFEMPNEAIVYVKVQHEKLRQVWWKPDYPVSKFGFNPHITLYQGSDFECANRLCEFLRREDPKLVTWGFAVATHVSDHKDLFAAPGSGDTSILGLVNRGLIKPDFVVRLERALNRSRQAA